MNGMAVLAALVFVATPPVCLLAYVPGPTCDINAEWDGSDWIISCVDVDCAPYSCSFQPEDGTDADATTFFIECVCSLSGGQPECRGQFFIDTETDPPTVGSPVCDNSGAPCNEGDGTCQTNEEPPHVNGVPGPVWVPCACK